MPWNDRVVFDLVADTRAGWDWVFDLGGLAAAIGTVAALFVLVRQSRQTQEELESLREAALETHFDATAQRILDLDRILLERPALRRHLYRGRDGGPAHLPSKEPERGEAEAVAEYVIDMLDTELLRDVKFVDVRSQLPDFEAWIRDLIADSEPVCYMITTYWEWYSEALLARYADMADRGRAALVPPDGRWRGWLAKAALPEKWREVVGENAGPSA